MLSLTKGIIQLGIAAVLMSSLSLTGWTSEPVPQTDVSAPDAACEEQVHPGYRILPYPDIDQQLAE